MPQCSGAMGVTCYNRATWENQNGVKVCNQHKLLMNAFTFEGRNKRKWKKIKYYKTK
jgi:hypothetical protein